MNNTNLKIFKTGIGRKFFAWFFAISFTLMTLFSGILEISDTALREYSFVASSVIIGILFSKGFDTNLKNKNEIQRMKNDKKDNKKDEDIGEE